MYCTIFLEPLSLGNVIEEQQSGLARKFTVLCSQCNAENTINTSKEQRSGARGPLTFDVNTRAALGYLCTGVGNTHLNNLLSTLNVPARNSSTFKSQERGAGKAIELVAKNSCQQFLNLEQEKAIENGNKPDQNNVVPVAYSHDMGWQKRGRGFNSKTGHAAVMSLSTGKVLDYTTKNKMCGSCDEAKRQENNQKPMTVEKIIQALQSQRTLQLQLNFSVR